MPLHPQPRCPHGRRPGQGSALLRGCVPVQGSAGQGGRATSHGRGGEDCCRSGGECAERGGWPWPCRHARTVSTVSELGRTRGPGCGGVRFRGAPVPNHVGTSARRGLRCPGQRRRQGGGDHPWFPASFCALFARALPKVAGQAAHGTGTVPDAAPGCSGRPARCARARSSAAASQRPGASRGNHQQRGAPRSRSHRRVEGCPASSSWRPCVW